MRERRAVIEDARNKAALIQSELEELEAEVAAAEEQKIIAENVFADARSGLQEISKTVRPPREALIFSAEYHRQQIVSPSGLPFGSPGLASSSASRDVVPQDGTCRGLGATCK